MESMSKKWLPFRTDLILGKRKKSHGASSGLCEQERYCDGAYVRGLLKGSASYHALIFRDAEESLSRRFNSLFGLGVGI